MEEQAVRGGGSQWNQAGTYEEKGMTKWVADRLRAALVAIGRGGGLSGGPWRLVDFGRARVGSGPSIAKFALEGA